VVRTVGDGAVGIGADQHGGAGALAGGRVVAQGAGVDLEGADKPGGVRVAGAEQVGGVAEEDNRAAVGGDGGILAEAVAGRAVSGDGNQGAGGNAAGETIPASQAVTDPIRGNSGMMTASRRLRMTPARTSMVAVAPRVARQ
jgi:hypothetical protein